jgi:environmental stress-induced protein Ves
VFAGVDRRMAILEGRLALFIEGESPLTLSRDSPAVSFAGEVPVFAEPLGSLVTDLNVMTRRGRCSAALTRHTMHDKVEVAAGSGTRLLLARADLSVRGAGVAARLAPLDALLAAKGSTLAIESDGAGGAVFDLIEICFT